MKSNKWIDAMALRAPAGICSAVFTECLENHGAEALGTNESGRCRWVALGFVGVNTNAI